MTATIGGLRRLRRPTVDARVVTGIVLVAVSVIGGLRLARGPEPGTRVFAAAADLDAGHVLTRDDLAETDVRASRAMIAGLERADRGAPGRAGAPHAGARRRGDPGRRARRRGARRAGRDDPGDARARARRRDPVR